MKTSILKSNTTPIKAVIGCRSPNNSALFVLVHGGPTLSGNYLQPLMNRLVENFGDRADIAHLDLPNHGGSWNNSKLRDFNSTLEIFAEFVGSISSAYSEIRLIGHSFGAIISAAAASHINLSQLILISMPSSLPFKHDFRTKAAAIRNGFSDLSDETQYAQYIYELTDHYFHNPVGAETKTLITSELHLAGNENALAGFESPRELIESLMSAKPLLPIEFIDGENEPLFDPFKRDDFTNGVLGFSRVGSSGHYPMLENPVSFQAVLANALNKIKISSRQNR